MHGGECALGVIPLENVLQGSVGQCFDLFMEYDVYIQTESVARIQHTLLSVESSPEAIKVVYSHPQALAQCQRWLRQHLPEASLMACDSTAAAARRAVSEPGSAAIGHKSLSTMLGLPILAYNLEDEPTNQTRFVVIGPKPIGHFRSQQDFGTVHAARQARFSGGYFGSAVQGGGESPQAGVAPLALSELEIRLFRRSRDEPAQARALRRPRRTPQHLPLVQAVGLLHGRGVVREGK